MKMMTMKDELDGRNNRRMKNIKMIVEITGQRVRNAVGKVKKYVKRRSRKKNKFNSLRNYRGEKVDYFKLLTFLVFRFKKMVSQRRINRPSHLKKLGGPKMRHYVGGPYRRAMRRRPREVLYSADVYYIIVTL